MIPDITIRNYYLQFIYTSKCNADKYKKELDNIIKLKKEVYNYINSRKQIVKDDFNIDLNNIEVEWINKEYNTKEYLYNLVMKLNKDINEHPNKEVLIQLIKYCNCLRNEYNNTKSLKFANVCKNLNYKQYRKYVAIYYNKVHECVLNGFGYKFSYGIGTYVINHWKLDSSRMKNKVYLDYAATNTRKKELIEQGVKLYDDKEAAWYAARHIPYTAVDYRVYKNDGDWYEFTFINSEISKSSTYNYQRTEYVSSKYRGMSYTQIADTFCQTENDIYNLQVDIKYKLNMLLYKDPTKYLNYVRNAEQCKYKRGAHNS